jgi:hypothetical protein
LSARNGFEITAIVAEGGTRGGTDVGDGGIGTLSVITAATGIRSVAAGVASGDASSFAVVVEYGSHASRLNRALYSVRRRGDRLALALLEILDGR